MLFRSLFNLLEDPGERRDLAGEERYKPFAEQCLAKIHARWSAEKMLEGAAREKRAQELIFAAGQPIIPQQNVIHGIPDTKSHNYFDRSQLIDNKPVSQEQELTL